MARSLCRRPVLRALALALFASLGCSLAAAGTAAAATKRYIVIFEKSSAAGARVATNDIAHDEDVTPTQRYDDALHGFAARLDAHDLREVRDDPRVAAVVPDRPVAATSLVPLAAGDNSPLGVRRVGAATTTTAHEASSVNVAVIDTGIDLSHPDLNAAAGTNCNGTGAPTDGNGHGTHVAGTIAAKNNGSGAVGVAPGTKVWAVRVLNSSGSGYTSNIICGIDWVTSTRTDSNAANDIAVANMSLGGSMPPYANCGRSVNDAEHIAICNSIAAGVTYVVAAGNSSTDEQNFAPANYAEVLTVTAVSDSDGQPGAIGGTLSCIANGDDQPASYSNYATRAADIAHTIAAPGSCIRSTYPGSQYATMSGTSMASPHVAGLVALCMGEAGAQGPCWGQSPATVVSMMQAASASTAAAAPGGVFNGAPSRPIAGKYYGDMASTAFPSAVGAMPVNTAVPAISGTASTLTTLTATQGTWTGSGNTYTTQWIRCTSTALNTCTDIAGATSQTYAPVAADAGRYLRVRVVATNADGSAMVRSNPTTAVTTPVAPVNTVAPTTSGYAQVGRTLTGRNGTWTGTAPITYATQWVRCTSATLVSSCTDISGATAATYAPVVADVGKYLRVAFTATNARATALARSIATPVVTNPGTVSSPTLTAPVNTALPMLAGMPAATHTLTFRVGTWTGSPTYTYQWQRCTSTATSSCLNIPSATGTSFLLTTTDQSKYMRIVVTATNSRGSVAAQSPPLGPVA
ncbi:MAG TPA: S8 family serine peptidase [Baekduia sp.]|nr:S8 family serine peptidase [Baekduia sp.]